MAAAGFSFESVVGLAVLFPGSIHALGGFLGACFPDADLVLTASVAHDVCADAPIVVGKGCLEDHVVGVVVAGEGGCHRQSLGSRLCEVLE